jgi:hypothetical protein
MSIVTLKRKTLAQYRNNSHSPNGFSLNGTHRNQGYVGQTSLSRSSSRTLMKGNTPKGHGGCCGQYYIGPIVQTGVTSLEDPAVVKKSTLNTHGLIDTKYRWIRRPVPFASVKAITRINSQSEYIYYRVQKKLKETHIDGTPCHTDAGKDVVYKKCITLDNEQLPAKCPPNVKPLSYTGAISSGEYLYNLNKKCVFVDDLKIYTPLNRTYFTCASNIPVYP